MMKYTLNILMLLFGLLLLTSFSKNDTNTPAQSLPTTYYYPPSTGNTWETVNPADLGWDVAKLNEAIDYIGTNNSDAFIILYKGRIVTEKYWNRWTATKSGRIFSATKSVVGLMIGLAQEQGKVDITKKVSDYLGTGWSKAKLSQENQITIRHLLTMTSGLDNRLKYDAPTGTKWYYNTSAYQKNIDILEKVYGTNILEISKAQLWSKIGMQNASWESAPDGVTISCSGRDMARFGLMVISDGKWNGTPIMTNTTYFQAMLNTSQDLNPAYGYLWWLNGKSAYVLPSLLPSRAKQKTGGLIPNAPADLISALGANDKKIYILKSKDLVVIRHGSKSNAEGSLALSNFDNEIWKRLMLAIK